MKITFKMITCLMPLLRPEALRVQTLSMRCRSMAPRCLRQLRLQVCARWWMSLSHPCAHHIVEEERARYPGIEVACDDQARLELEDERTRREIDHADLLLCPGMNVVEGLANFPNASGKAYAVVPYGCGVSFGGMKNKPVKGRVLFAGTADLRKGIHYLGHGSGAVGQ